MKKLCLVAIAVAFSVCTFAQAPRHGERREFKPEEMATRMADGMKKELGLNDKQYKSVYDLYLKRGEEMKALREKGEQGQQVDREVRRAEMQKQQEATNAELKKILTSKQYTKYEKWQQQRQQEQQKRHKQGGPRGSHGGQGMPPRN